MKKPLRSPKDPNVTPPVYTPPQRLLITCPNPKCGMTVLGGLSKEGGRIETLPEPLTPVFGYPHVCQAKEAVP